MPSKLCSCLQAVAVSQFIFVRCWEGAEQHWWLGSQCMLVINLENPHLVNAPFMSSWVLKIIFLPCYAGKSWPILLEDVATQSAVAEDYSSHQCLLIPDTLLHVHQVEGLEPLVLRAVEATAATPDLQGMHVFNSMCWTLSEYKVVGGLNRVDSEFLCFKTLILQLILDCSILGNMKVVQTSHLIGGIKHLLFVFHLPLDRCLQIIKPGDGLNSLWVARTQ